MPGPGCFSAIGAYIRDMKKLVLAFLLASGPAFAQTLPEDPALQRAQSEASINQTLQQTQQNNTILQFQLQQNEARQQQLFNTLPPPTYGLPAYAPPTPLMPPPQKN
jgi:hypothetical protein